VPVGAGADAVVGMGPSRVRGTMQAVAARAGGQLPVSGVVMPLPGTVAGSPASSPILPHAILKTVHE
jgi:hypothetical protein